MRAPAIAIKGNMEDNASANLQERPYAMAKPVMNEEMNMVLRPTFSEMPC